MRMSCLPLLLRCYLACLLHLQGPSAPSYPAGPYPAPHSQPYPTGTGAPDYASYVPDTRYHSYSPHRLGPPSGPARELSTATHHTVRGRTGGLEGGMEGGGEGAGRNDVGWGLRWGEVLGPVVCFVCCFRYRLSAPPFPLHPLYPPSPVPLLPPFMCAPHTAEPDNDVAAARCPGDPAAAAASAPTVPAARGHGPIPGPLQQLPTLRQVHCTGPVLHMCMTACVCVCVCPHVHVSMRGCGCMDACMPGGGEAC